MHKARHLGARSLSETEQIDSGAQSTKANGLDSLETGFSKCLLQVPHSPTGDIKELQRSVPGFRQGQPDVESVRERVGALDLQRDKWGGRGAVSDPRIRRHIGGLGPRCG